MSIILPNGASIHPTSLEALKEIERQLREGEPIVTKAVHLDGTVSETVLWRPDDHLADQRRNKHPDDDRG